MKEIYIMKKKLLKILIVGVVLLIVGIPVLYLLVTSSFFIKSAILPYASKKAGFDIRAKEVNLSLWSSTLAVSGFEAGPEAKPFAKIAKIEAAWGGLGEIMSGNIKIGKLHVSDGNISIDEAVLKSLNAANTTAGKAPAAKTVKKKEAPKAVAPAKPAEVQKLKFDVKDVVIEKINANVALKSFTLDAKNLSVKLPEFKTGGDASVTISGDLALKAGNNVHVEHCFLNNRIAFSLNEELKPAYVDYLLKIDQFTGRIKDIKLADRNITAALKSKFDNSLNSSTIEEFYIKEFSGGKVVSSAALSGHVSLVPMKCALALDVSKVSPELIYTFAPNLDVGNPAPTLKSKIFFEGGKAKCSGALLVKSLKAGKGNVPKIDVKADFDANADVERKTAGITMLAVDVSEGARKLVGVNLSKPAQISWADKKVKIEGDSPEIKAQVAALDISTVSAFLPPDSLPVTEGRINVLVDGKVAKNGQDVSVRARASAANLKLKDYGKPDSRYHVELESDFNLKNSKKFEDLNLVVGLHSADKSKRFLALDLKKGKYDTGSGEILVPFKTAIGPDIVEFLPEDLRKQKFLKLTEGYSTSLESSVKGSIKKKDIQLSNTALALRKQDSSITVSAKDPVRVNWGKKISGLKDIPFKASIAIERYPLERIDYVMPQKGAFKLLSGVTTEKLDVVNNGKELSAKGVIAASGLSFAVNNEKYGPMTLAYRTDSKMPLDFEGITLNDETLELGAGKDMSAEIKFKGPMTFNEFTTDLDISLEKLDSGILKVLPAKMVESTKLKQFTMNGKSHLALDTERQILEADGVYAIREILTRLPSLKQDKILNSDIAFDLFKDNKETEFRSFSLNLFNESKELAGFFGSGRVKNEKGLTDVYLKLASENIDFDEIRNHLVEKEAAPAAGKEKAAPAKPQKSAWKKSADMMGSFLQTAVNALKGVADSTVTPRQEPVLISDNLDSTEPAAIDLKWLKLKADSDFEKISWTKHVVASLKSRLTVIDNVIRDTPEMKINKAPLNAKIMLDPGHSDGYPFDVKVDMKKLDLAPLFKAAFKDSLAESKGSIDSLSIDAAGKGFSPANMQNKMKAIFKMQSSDLLIKSDVIDNSYVLQILFLPLQVFGEMQSFLPANSCSREMASSISQVRGNINNISLKTGSVEVVAEKKILIKECEFTGPFIKKLKLEGAAGFNQNLFLTSTLNVSSIAMPMDINGTFSNPEPDINKMIPDFLRQNASNIINSSTEVKDTIKKIGTEIQDGLKDLKGLKKIKF